MSRRRIVATIAALDQAAQQGEDLASSLSGDLERVAQGSASASSQKLFGVLGAGIGAASAVGLTVATGISVVLTTPILIAIGGAAGVLLWRGRKGLRFEKEMHYRGTILGTIVDEINRLPKNAPKAVREGLWAEYQAIVQGYGKASAAALSSRLVTAALPPASSPMEDEERSTKAANKGGIVHAPNTGAAPDV